MKKTTYKVSQHNLPTKLPIYQTAVIWLLLDRFSAPGWAYGVALTIMGLGFVVCAVGLYLETWVDISTLLKLSNTKEEE